MGAEVITARSARVAAILREQQRARAQNIRWKELAKIGHRTLPGWVPDRDPTHDRYSLTKTLADGSWKGHRAFIIGGGPSLIGFDFSRLKGELVIAVNRAYENVDAQILASMDARFYSWIVNGILGPEAQKAFSEFKGIKLWLDMGDPIGADAHLVPMLGKMGIPGKLADGLYHGNNSGFVALEIAYCLGADPICLLGFDMKFDGGRSNFHDGYPDKSEERTTARYAEIFNEFAGMLPPGSPRIINLNPDSALRCFEFGTFDALPMPLRTTYVTFYTNDAYRHEADKLLASARRFNLECQASAVPDKGDWQANNQYKPIFLRQMLDRMRPRPVMWLDADASFRAQPFLIDTLAAEGYDAAVHYRAREELLGSAIWLANNDKARELLDLWIKENEAHPPDRFDQANLADAIKQWSGRLFELPPQYCQIYDIMADVQDPVITQYQASRRLKNSPAGLSAEVKSNAGLVSVMMPAFNAGRWIGQAIASALAQTHREIELIIVDDGSTDNTAAIATAAVEKDSRVRLIRHEKNRGEGAARNTAVAASRGAYIARLDADDWDDPSRIEKSLTRLEGKPLTDTVSCQAYWCEGGTRRIFQDSPHGMIPELFMYHKPGGSPINASIVAKREIYDLAGRFDERLEVGTDSDWDIRAIMAGTRWAYIPEPLYFYRRHPGQAVNKVPVTEHNRRQLERCKAQQAAWEDSFNNPNRTLEIYTNSGCTRSCRFCSQADFIKAMPGYEIGLAGILEICERAKENGATYEWAQFTGGEPLLWEDLAKAAILAKQIGPFKKVRILTNLDKAERADALLQSGTIDGIYTTMANNNRPAVQRFFEKYPNRIRIDHLEKFKPLPTKPHSGTRPAECHCPRFAIIGRDVYPCGNFFNHVTRLGQDPRTRSERCSIEEDWIAHFRTIDRFNMDICEICLGNGRVWSQVSYPES